MELAGTCKLLLTVCQHQKSLMPLRLFDSQTPRSCSKYYPMLAWQDSGQHLSQGYHRTGAKDS